MQISPLPTAALPTTALPQDAVTKVLPQVQAQASPPLIQRAIDPSPRSERNPRSKSNGDRAKGGGGGDKSGTGGRGGSVNIRV